jgi:hypothetical protein
MKIVEGKLSSSPHARAASGPAAPVTGMAERFQTCNRRELLALAALVPFALPLANAVAGSPETASGSLRSVLLVYDDVQPESARGAAEWTPADWRAMMLSRDIVTSWSEEVACHLSTGGLLVGVTTPEALFCLERMSVAVGAQPLWRRPFVSPSDARHLLAATSQRAADLAPVGFLHPALARSPGSKALFGWVIGRHIETQRTPV